MLLLATHLLNIIDRRKNKKAIGTIRKRGKKKQRRIHFFAKVGKK